MSDVAWIGVDLDGTLAFYDKWRGNTHIGDPVPKMLERVKRWIADGVTVKIFTARVAETGLVNVSTGVKDTHEFAEQQIELIQIWCIKHIGVKLPVTATKDMNCIAIYDDRCFQVEANTGRLIHFA